MAHMRIVRKQWKLNNPKPSSPNPMFRDHDAHPLSSLWGFPKLSYQSPPKCSYGMADAASIPIATRVVVLTHTKKLAQLGVPQQPSFPIATFGGFPKLGVPFWGLDNKDYSILGSILVPLF